MNKLGIKSKILLMTILPVLITACLLSFIFVNQRLNDMEAALQEKGQIISRHLAPSLAFAISSGNQTYLDALAKNTLAIPEVCSVTIVGTNQHILSQRKNSASRLSSLNDKAMANMIFSSNIYRSDPDADNKIIGTLVIEISRESITENRREIIYNGIAITLVALILTIVMALYFSRTITSPIRSLIHGIHRIRDGQLGERIFSGAGGEIAVLETGINNMSASLQLAQLREKERIDDTLFIERSKAQITLEAIGEGVITTDRNGFISYLNPAAENLLEVKMDYATGLHLHEIFHLKNMIEKEDIHYPLSVCLEEGKSIRHDDPLILVSAKGTEFIIRDSASPIRARNGEVTGMVLVFHDFTHIQRISDQLTYQAKHDELTGLKNRREFELRLKALIADSNFEKQSHAVCYLDLDHFKMVNDTCGHIAGDALLKEVARLIHSQVRHNDLVARLGGDEFGIILINCPIKQAVLVAENIKDTIKEYQCKWEQHVFDIGVSIGLMPISSADCSPAEVMINVDTACYIAKGGGKNRVHVYQATDHDSLQRHNDIRWLQKINRALDKDGFELYCQAIAPVDNQSEKIKYEILLRLNDRGTLTHPGDFLPAAEHYSLMPDIDRWVIKAFMEQINENAVDALKNRKHIFNINISGQSICNDGFLDYIVALFASYSIQPQLITFEITETATIHNYSAASKFIRRLQKLGCGFALDDFGSGLSSFRYLRELPVDYLKIDGYFINDIENNTVNQSIVDAVTRIAQVLNLETIAEFVESEATLQAMEKFKVDYIQGSAIEMPVPLEDVLSRFK